MKDSRVDLCGELGHDGEEYVCLGRDESFTFACSGCGGCCRGREDIVLSGYDLYRIARRLRLPPKMVVRAFCRQYTGTSSRMPVVRLAPLRDQGSNCPFLNGNRCAIHDAEPLVCALYPLGQEISLDGTIRYFAQHTECGGTIYEAKTEDFLARYDIPAREELDSRWALTCIRLSRRMKEWEKELEPMVLHRLQDKLLHALYLDYDYEAPYLPQLEANVSRFEASAEKIAKMRIRRR